MNKSILALAITACLPQFTLAANYTSTVDLSNILIKAGDTIKTSSSGIISTNSAKTNPINLGNGNIIIELNAPDTTGEIHAILLSDRANHNLGKGSIINLTKDTPTNNNDYAIRLSNTNLTADQLNINLSLNSGTAYGLHAENASINLGSSSKIILDNKQADSPNYGIRLNDSNLTADKLLIKATNGIGIEATNSNIQLGNNSKIFSTGKGICLDSSDGNESKLTASGLHIEVSTRYAILTSGNKSTIDLGTGSKITSHAVNSHAIWINVKDYSNHAFKADKLTIQTTQKGSMAIDFRAGNGSLINSTIITENAGGILVYDDDQDKYDVNFSIENTTFNTGRDHSILSYGARSTVNLKNITSHLNVADNASAASIRAVAGSTVNSTNLYITTQGEKSYGVYANTGAKVNLEGNTVIKSLTSNNQPAIFANRGAIINSNSTFTVNGLISALGNGRIELNSKENSYFTSSLHTETGSIINWKAEKTHWNVTANSSLNSLNFDQNSHINLAYGDGYNSLNVHDFSGASNLYFKVNLNTQEANTLHIANTSSGNHQVFLNNNGSAKTNGTEKINIISTSDGAASFSSPNQYEYGGYLYAVQRKDKDPHSSIWEVASTGQKTDPAKSSTATVIGNYLLNLAEQEHLTKRMAEIHTDSSATGTWIRSYTGKLSSFSSSHLSGFDMRYFGVQMGADGLIKQDADGSWYAGGAIGHSDSKQNYRAGSGTQRSYNATLYATYVNENQWYSDFYLKYAHYKNDIDIRDTLGKSVKGKGSTNTISASAEISKRYNVNQAFYYEPNAQLTVGYIDSSKISNANGLNVHFKAQKSLITRAGSYFGYSTEWNQQPVNLYTKLHYAHEFAARQKYKLNHNKEHLNFSGNWLEYGVGASTTINKQHSLFIEANGSDGSRFNRYDINLGYRYQF